MINNYKFSCDISAGKKEKAGKAGKAQIERVRYTDRESLKRLGLPQCCSSTKADQTGTLMELKRDALNLAFFTGIMEGEGWFTVHCTASCEW